MARVVAGTSHVAHNRIRGADFMSETTGSGRARKIIPRAAAGLMVAVLFFQARVPDIAARERSQLASRFHFTRYTLPVESVAPAKTVRSVHPSLKRINAWISSVGAAGAPGDPAWDGPADHGFWWDPP